MSVPAGSPSCGLPSGPNASLGRDDDRPTSADLHARQTFDESGESPDDGSGDLHRFRLPTARESDEVVAAEQDVLDHAGLAGFEFGALTLTQVDLDGLRRPTDSGTRASVGASA